MSADQSIVMYIFVYTPILSDEQSIVRYIFVFSPFCQLTGPWSCTFLCVQLCGFSCHVCTNAVMSPKLGPFTAFVHT